jgi:ABC-type uncharacterized transport system permease subunit
VELALLSLALVGYLAGTALSVVGMVRGSARATRGSNFAWGIAWIVHVAALVYRGWMAGGFPMSNSGEFLLALGWGVMALYFLVWLKWRIGAAGLVLAPLAAVMVAASIGVVPGATQPIAHGTRGLFVFHTTAAMLGLAALGLAFAMSLIYLVQDRTLKSKQSFAMLDRLPSLEASDRIGHQALLLGFPLLTLGIVTGMIWNLITHNAIWTGSPKEIFPTLAWILFALLLVARSVWGYRGRRAAYLTIAGFALGLLTILGIAR